MAQITKIIADRTNRPNDLVVPGETVNMRFIPGKRALSLRAGKAFHLLVKHAGVNLTSNKKHTIALSDLTEIANLTHSQLADLVYELQITVVEISHVIQVSYTDDGMGGNLYQDERMITSGPLIDFVQRPKTGDKGKLTYRFSEALRSIFEDSTHWAIIQRRSVMAFESRYGLRLFELISLRANLVHKSSELFNLEDLRAHLGVPEDRLIRWQDVKAFALEPAIKEVNHIAPFKVSYEPIKHGRSVTGVKLSWKIKEDADLKATKKELDAHKSGRKARREGAAETLIELPIFPSDGSIAYGHWEQLVRQHGPKPTPDLNELASKFRGWALYKGIPFDDPSIEKVFIGFCQKYGR